MASEMTTEEMVDKCKRIGEGADERLRCKEAEAIAARLSALDKAAKAAEWVVGSQGVDGKRIDELDAALKEAGYGE